MARRFTTISKDDKMADDKKKKYGLISFDALSEGHLPGESSSQHVAGKVVYKPEKNCPQCGKLNPINANKCTTCDFDFRSPLNKLLGTGTPTFQKADLNEELKKTKELLGKTRAIVPVSGGIVPTSVPTQQGVLRRKATVADTTCTRCNRPAKLITDKDGIVSIDCPIDGRFIFSIPSGSTISPQAPSGLFLPTGTPQPAAQVVARASSTPSWTTRRKNNLLGLASDFLPTKNLISDRAKKNIFEVGALMLGAAIVGFLGFYFLATALALAAFWMILPSQSSVMGEAMAGVERGAFEKAQETTAKETKNKMTDLRNKRLRLIKLLAEKDQLKLEIEVATRRSDDEKISELFSRMKSLSDEIAQLQADMES